MVKKKLKKYYCSTFFFYLYLSLPNAFLHVILKKKKFKENLQNRKNNDLKVDH